jgi:hypothetical protein
LKFPDQPVAARSQLANLAGTLGTCRVRLNRTTVKDSKGLPSRVKRDDEQAVEHDTADDDMPEMHQGYRDAKEQL